MSTIVHVKNIGGQTEDKEIRDFFSFCGKISSIDITTEGASKNATVRFEKETAARTALLLNHTQLGGNEITVTGDNVSTPPHDSSSGDAADRAAPELTQEEKPRSRILAEVLANGYLVADRGLQGAISLDEQHNISSRFVATLKQLDDKTHATDHARAADASYHITERASSWLTGLGSYFEKARDTPTGKRIVGFYTTGTRQVQDIHNEARRLAELKKKEGEGWAVDKVFEKFQGGGAAAAGAEEKKEVPGAAPADAVATESAQKPTAPSGTGNPEILH
ncbi:Protein vip1 [Collariella sp. IMI 366227]|nr:Protein vip1 [Collariella sp. IMI 366227]